MNELLCCPFCGGNAELKTYRDKLRGDTFAAMCKKTDCPGRTYKKHVTQKADAEAWNRRATPENRVLTLEELCESADAADWGFVWIESKSNTYDVSGEEQVCPWYKTATHLAFAYVAEGKNVTREEDIAKIGKEWRCWLRKPTEKEMAATPWAGEEMNKGMYSSETDEWETPKDLFSKLDAVYHFDLDVCATKENAKCARYFTREQDALGQEWKGMCWMNPPYGRQIGKWVKKAYGSAKAGATVVCLVPARTDTDWWHDYVMRGGCIHFIRGRLRFGGGKGNAPFPSAVVVFDGLFEWMKGAI